MRTVDKKIVVALHEIRDAIGGEGSSSSKEITIDDVVKFIHDEMGSEFPYTTYDEIPEFGIPAEMPTGLYRTDKMINVASNTFVLLCVPIPLGESYIIMHYNNSNSSDSSEDPKQ